MKHIFTLLTVVLATGCNFSDSAHQQRTKEWSSEMEQRIERLESSGSQNRFQFRVEGSSLIVFDTHTAKIFIKNSETGTNWHMMDPFKSVTID